MRILPNDVAVTGTTHHVEWCEKEGLIHDKWMAGIIHELITSRQIKTCIDGGCHIGTLSRVMLDAGANVIGIDANKDALQCASYNCRLFPQAQFIHGALHHCSAGKARLKINLENAGATYCEPTLEQSGMMLVDTITIDEVAAGERIGLIKLDIEGAEVDALMGAIKTIERDRPAIICEVNDGALQRRGVCPENIFGILDSINYRWGILQPDCDQDDPQYDILCLPI